jgi:hypothetical protein
MGSVTRWSVRGAARAARAWRTPGPPRPPCASAQGRGTAGMAPAPAARLAARRRRPPLPLPLLLAACCAASLLSLGRVAVAEVPLPTAVVPINGEEGMRRLLEASYRCPTVNPFGIPTTWGNGVYMLYRSYKCFIEAI